MGARGLAAGRRVGVAARVSPKVERFGPLAGARWLVRALKGPIGPPEGPGTGTAPQARGPWVRARQLQARLIRPMDTTNPFSYFGSVHLGAGQWARKE